MYATTIPNARLKGIPREDSFETFQSEERTLIVVADGITRDPHGFPVFPQKFTEPDIKSWLKGYPNPSPAQAAADCFTLAFVNYLQTTANSNPKDAFLFGNGELKELNNQLFPDVDYLCNDYAGCVAAGGLIEGDILRWAAITDCGLIVYTSEGEVKFQTEDWMSAFLTFLEPSNPWHLPEGREFVRKFCRNKPDLQHNNKCVSYGALTGEESAESFIHTGKVHLSSGDLVVFHSDGLTPVLKQPEFFDKANQVSEIDHLTPYLLDLARKDPASYGKEATIVAYRHL